MQVILQGSLRHFAAAELLAFLLSRGQAGTLDLDHAGRRTRVLFENDQIVWAESNNIADPTDALLDLFEWQGGSFTLLDSIALPENAQRLALTLSALQEEAKARAERAYRDDTLFRVVENPAQQQLSLSGDEFKILLRLTTGRTFGDLAAELGADRKQLEGRLKRLEELGLVEAGRREALPENPFAPKTEPIPVQDDAEATRVERIAIARSTRNTLAPKSAEPETDEVTAVQPPAAQAPSAEPPPVEPPPAEPPPAEPPPVERQKTLVGSLTPDEQPDSVYPLLDAECVIGRAPDCTVTISDGSISSRHARVVRSGEGFTIEDLQSRNGTFVNGEKVDKPRLLADGDVVRLGKIVMTFNVAQETVAAPKTQMMSLE